MKISTEIGWGDKPGGGRRVAISTLQAMAELKPDYSFTTYSNCLHPLLDKPNINQIILTPPPYLPKLIYDQLIFPHLSIPYHFSQDNHDVTHYTHNYISYLGGQPAIVTIHDMTPFVIPESFGKLHAAYQRFTFRIAARRAKHILTVSEHSKQDICHILKVPQERVTVTHLASDLRQRFSNHDLEAINLRAEFDINRLYILYVGAIHPRKNVERLIQAYAQLRSNDKITHQLVIAGSFRWMAEHILATAKALALSEDDIVFTGRVNDKQLATLFQNTSAFVYPSIYEGFGLPVLEAMSFGAPVITSTSSSLPEVAGDAAILVDPYSIDAIAEGIYSVISSDSLANDMRQKSLKRSEEFSWKNTAQKMLNVFENVASEHNKST